MESRSDFTAVACKVCGGHAHFLCTTHNQHGPIRRVNHFRCERCGLVFVGNHLSREEIGAAYATLDASAYYDEIRAENRRKFKRAIGDIQALPCGTRQRVLDIGSGNGEFCEQLLDAGFSHVAAHEIPGSNMSAICNRGVAVYQDFDYSSIPDGRFDLVTLLDVAEHVPDPVYLFRNCARVLRHGGSVYLHTPVVTWFDRVMHYTLRARGAARIGRLWQVGRTSIFHLQNYTEAALRIVLKQAGFDSVRIEVRNELSWPLHRYVRVYLCDKAFLPASFAVFVAPLFWPFLGTNLFNANKAIAIARRSAAYTVR